VAFVEQRGVGASTPALVCDTGVQDSESARACVATLQGQGADLAAYNSIQSAADLETLRTALGVRRWNLLGFSYGTKLALTMYRERPATIASLVLDGVLPPQQNLQDDPQDFAGVLDRIFSQCVADFGCATAFPDLRRRFVATLRELDLAPQTVNGVSLSGAALVNALSIFQTQPQLIEYLPAVMGAMANRDVGLLAALSSTTTLTSATGIESVFSDAMYFSVICNEEAPFSDRSQLAASVTGADPIRAAIARANLNNVAICDVWPSGRAPARDNLPVNVTVPMLVFNGEFDLQTEQFRLVLGGAKPLGVRPLLLHLIQVDRVPVGSHRATIPGPNPRHCPDHCPEPETPGPSGRGVDDPGVPQQTRRVPQGVAATRSLPRF
jgi:pimeloyl-ACP methyl ester carboxylesterase